MSNSSVFNVWVKVLWGLLDQQLYDKKFLTQGVLTLKAFADKAKDVRGTVSRSLSADHTECPS